MKPKLYLAGPEVFLPNAVEHAEEQRRLCAEYDFVPLHPLDNDLDLSNRDIETAVKIYRGDVKQIHACDIVVANCNPFRGVCMDDGTAYELGYGNALGKPSYGYIRELAPLGERTIRNYPTTLDNVSNTHIDKDGYVVTDDFGTSINLMMQGGMLSHQGRLIEGDFETCLRILRDDIDSGKLALA